MAAVVASVLFARIRLTQTAPEIQKGDVVEGNLSLEALRAAGI